MHGLECIAYYAISEVKLNVLQSRRPIGWLLFLVGLLRLINCHCMH